LTAGSDGRRRRGETRRKKITGLTALAILAIAVSMVKHVLKPNTIAVSTALEFTPCGG
jgi:hypothetical protein